MINEFSTTTPKDERFSLPNYIVKGKLTLEQIGAIACLVAFMEGQEDPRYLERINQHDMRLAMLELQQQGIMEAKLDGNDLKLEINYTAAGY